MSLRFSSAVPGAHHCTKVHVSILSTFCMSLCLSLHCFMLDSALGCKNAPDRSHKLLRWHITFLLLTCVFHACEFTCHFSDVFCGFSQFISQVWQLLTQRHVLFLNCLKRITSLCYSKNSFQTTWHHTPEHNVLQGLTISLQNYQQITVISWVPFIFTTPLLNLKSLVVWNLISHAKRTPYM